MSTLALSVLLASWGTSILLAYGAGARAGYWRGVARGQHAAGQIHAHVMAHVLYGSPIPPTSPDDLDAAKKPGAN